MTSHSTASVTVALFAGAIRIFTIAVVAAPGGFSQSTWPSFPNNSAIAVMPGGNVGIGTITPNAKLELGGGNIFRISGAGWQEFYNGSAVNGYIGYGVNLFTNS